MYNVCFYSAVLNYKIFVTKVNYTLTNKKYIYIFGSKYT